jgi:hypothetical protein
MKTTHMFHARLKIFGFSIDPKHLKYSINSYYFFILKKINIDSLRSMN